MQMSRSCLLQTMAMFLICGHFVQAEDKTDGKEHIVSAIDPETLTYEYLVDGNLTGDDPAKPVGVADDWDPTRTKDKYEAAGQGSLIYGMTLTNAAATIRTGGAGATIGATISPARADQSIKWSTESDLVSLSRSAGPNVVVTGNDVDHEVLSLEDTITPNRFGGAGVHWTGSVPRGNSNVYSLFRISYPNAKTSPSTH